MNFKSMTLKATARWIYALTLGGLSADILFRRFVWNQIPTQLPTALVYGVLLLNGFLIAFLFRRRAPSTRMGKS